MSDERPGLRLHNTLTRTKETFAPIDPANVRVYACGPTVYDRAHIGNARPLIVFDVLFRLLRHLYGEGAVTYARNVTDVDDKINARAAERGVTIRELTDETLAGFREDVAALRCLPPTVEPRATDHIPGMVALIDRLVARGHAYGAADHVLFEVATMRGYGALSRRPPEALLAGARVEVAPYKRSPLDFVLWKPSKPGEPSWPSPAGIAAPGRPGWHIECSAMSMKALLEPFGGGLACDDPLKNTFDVHAGGLDLIFPHHENEIAQTCCALGAERMANVWLHNGFLQVEGRKMSKSEGNFVTIHQLLNTEDFGGRRWPGEVLRLAMLRTHYRQPIDWTVEALEREERTLRRWSARRPNVAPSSSAVDLVFLAALGDDLNTPDALARVSVLLNAVHLAEPGIAVGETAGSVGIGPGYTGLETPEAIEANRAAAWACLDLLGIAPLLADQSALDDRQQALFDARGAARSARDWTESDRLRDELLALGLRVKDAKDGASTWERVS